ncbi:MAG: MFS transporter [Actinomycetes bacterium]
MATGRAPVSPPMSAPPPRALRRVVGASFVGTTIEWYDFFIYSTAAALVFGPQFFPGFSETAGILASFSTFAVGFAARPLGAMVMGHFGDRIGRKSMLVLSLVTMGVATFLIGCLPTYDTIGVWAPVLLVVLRFLQGFGVGGEWGGASLMAVEYAPPNRRGLYGAAAPMGTPAGVILSNLVFLGVTAAMPEDAFAAWGWRVPFLLSAVLVALGLVIRLKLEETPVFRRETARLAPPRAPIVEVLRTHPKQVGLGAVAFAGNVACGYILIAYVLSYGTAELGLSQSTMLACVLVAASSWLLTCFVAASWSDRLGRRRVYLFGAYSGLAWVFPLFWLIDTGQPVLVGLSLVVLTIPLAATFSPMAAMFSELFPTPVRYTGNSLTYQLGAVLGGGLTPLVAVALQGATGTTAAVSAYLFAVLLIGLVAIRFIPETSHRDLEEFAPPRTADATADAARA